MELFLVTLPPWLPAFLTVVILGAALYSFIREKLPPDLTSLLALLALLITGVLTPQEAFSGFSHPATVSVAAVLVLSAGLQRTGVLAYLARRLLVPVGRSETLLILVLMTVTAGLSAFVNNTAAVAVFIPVVLEVSRRTGVAASRVLMPMSIAATLGGMCTLIGTSINLIGHSVARYQGYQGFTMFEIGQVGFPMLIAGFVYLLLIGRWLLPRHESGIEALPERAGTYLSELVVPPGSSWKNREVSADKLRRDFELDLVNLVRAGQPVTLGAEAPRYQPGDHLRVRGPLEQVLALAARGGLELHRPEAWSFAPLEAANAGERPTEEGVRPGTDPPAGNPGALAESDTSQPEAAAPPAKPAPKEEAPRPPLAEFVLLPGSPLVGRTLKHARFAERYDAIVLALHRPGELLSERPHTTPIRAGDVLVVEGKSSALQALADTPGFLLVGSLERPQDRPHKLWIALLTIAGVVLAVSMGLLPIVTAAVAGCAVLMLTGALTPREAYQAIDWRVIFVLAGALALATALEKTGLTGSLANGLASLPGVAGPWVVMGTFLVVSSAASQMLSNAGTVALLAPLAVSSAVQMGMNPMALLVAVTLGASTSFATPIAYQTNLMIYGPGGYRFMDYVRVGLPLNLLLIVLAIWLIPDFWPLVLP